MSWREVQSDGHAAYLDARHRLLYFEIIAKKLAPFIPAPDAIVLDYGCGEALAAELFAATCARLYLYAGAPRIEAALRARYADVEKITVLSEAELLALPEAGLDMISCSSIFQHLSHEECRDLATFAAEKLKLGGRIVVSDVVPAHDDGVADALSFLDFSYRSGFFFAALRGLGAEAFAKCRLLRGRRRSAFTIPEMLRLLSIEGFEARRLEHNIGYNSAHMTFIGKRV